MNKQVTPPVAVITGASSGIGLEAAKALAAKGWSVIGIGRNPERCATASAEIAANATTGSLATMICADLALMSDTVRVANEIAQLTDRVDVLLNNAGGVARELQLTPEGNENTFASNHLGHFLLTAKLLPLLRKSAQSTPAGATRIINVSSAGHAACDGIDWDDPQMINNFVSATAYCRAKLANILFTREMAKRLSKDGIIAHAMHPGIVASNFINHADDAMQSYLRTQDSLSPAMAADTLIWLASAEEPGQSTGEYFFQRKSVATSPAAQDDDAAQRLWIESEKYVQQSLQH